jgi:hypothetical protein
MREGEALVPSSVAVAASITEMKFEYALQT